MSTFIYLIFFQIVLLLTVGYIKSYLLNINNMST